MSETIVRTGEDAEERLHELGLEREFIDEAIDAGVGARRPTDDFEPRSAAGLKDWIARVGKLRSRLVENTGWLFDDPLNVPLVFDHSRSVAVGVLLGDGNTGSSWKTEGPHSKYPKGKVISQATAKGEEVFALDLDLTQPGGRGRLTPDELRGMDVWFLVTHALTARDGEQERFEVHREISLAQPIEPETHITRWRERLVLPPRLFSPVPQQQETEEPEDIEVYVRAK
ncbi:hypothetical protein ACOQFL_17360 [Actinopolyspora sp. H202]|uniref:hypothetical protein n=1 Tax=Actinopolyspora sp. H202 TaxID=1500456 RepID=UPI003EE4634A